MGGSDGAATATRPALIVISAGFLGGGGMIIQAIIIRVGGS